MVLRSINPVNGQVFQSYECMGAAEIDQILNQSHEAYSSWSTTSLEHKIDLFKSLQSQLQQKQESMSRLITQEMGKPITQARAEIDKCMSLCSYYIQEGPGFLKDEMIATQYAKSYRCFKPMGIVLAIMPWNFPVWQVMRFAVPNLMLGNAGLLKHAPNVTGCALAIEQLFLEAGFPEHLFRSLLMDVDPIPSIIQDARVCGVTLTGSERAGQAVASQAGLALKKVVLELGGSDPYLILEDADLRHAAEQCIISRLNNAGQVCIAAKRIIAVDSIHDALVQELLQAMNRYVMGDPMDAQCWLGPMARDDLRAQFHLQVQRSIAAGAECKLGGQLPQGEGYYYPATLLTHVLEDSPAFKEELFGPAVTVIKAQDAQEAVRLANASPFGLGAAVFTADVLQGERIAKNLLHAGTCSVNTYVASHPGLPFGGIKRSGYGRELAMEGMREFANIKTIAVQ